MKVANRAVEQHQEWDAKYRDAPQHLEKKYRISVEINRVQLRLHHQNYMHHEEHSISTIFAYNRLHNGFESLRHKYRMPAIGTLEAIRGREIIFQEIRQYIEVIKQAKEWEGLEVTKDIIPQYAITPVKAHMNSWLWNNVLSSSKTILIEALEVKNRYIGDLVV